jgi:undecaprenyl-diphosphatase
MSDPAPFTLWQVVVLAVVQGVTEFLPISSDGHLVIIAPLLFGGSTRPPEMMDLTIVLHLGTLASILVYYRQRIARLLGEDRRVIPLLVVGTLPAVALVIVSKLLFKEYFEKVLNSSMVAGLMLPVTGLVLLWSLRRTPGKREYRDLTWIDSLIIGICQATAILPGLSRSGTTIGSGLGVGLNRPAAATYSFLLAIPALFGAGCYQALDLLRGNGSLSTSPPLLLLGALISFAVGLVAISLLERLLLRGQLRWFGWYCIALGVVVVIWQLSSR